MGVHTYIHARTQARTLIPCGKIVTLPFQKLKSILKFLMTLLLHFIFNLIGIQVNSAFKIYLESYPFSPSPLPKP